MKRDQALIIKVLKKKNDNAEHTGRTKYAFFIE